MIRDQINPLDRENFLLSLIYALQAPIKKQIDESCRKIIRENNAYYPLPDQEPGFFSGNKALRAHAGRFVVEDLSHFTVALPPLVESLEDDWKKLHVEIEQLTFHHQLIKQNLATICTRAPNKEALRMVLPDEFLKCHDVGRNLMADYPRKLPAVYAFEDFDEAAAKAVWGNNPVEAFKRIAPTFVYYMSQRLLCAT